MAESWEQEQVENLGTTNGKRDLTIWDRTTVRMRTDSRLGIFALYIHIF